MQRLHHHGGDLEGHGLVDVMADIDRFDGERLHQLIAKHAALYGLGARQAHSRRLGRIPAEIPQGDAGGIPPRACRAQRGTCAARVRARGRLRMGKVTGFLEIDRRERRYAPASDRIRNYREFMLPLSEEATRDQAARCMDCGIPYCHNGCPVNNQIPDWNDLVYQRRLARRRSRTFIPPTIFRNSPAASAPRLAKPRARSTFRTRPSRSRRSNAPSSIAAGRRAGSSPSRRRGARARRSPWSARVRRGSPAPSSSHAPGTRCMSIERNAKPGGLLRYGIPDFKMEKRHVERRDCADGGGGRHFPLRRHCRCRGLPRHGSSRSMTRSC